MNFRDWSNEVDVAADAIISLGVPEGMVKRLVLAVMLAERTKAPPRETEPRTSR